MTDLQLHSSMVETSRQVVGKFLQLGKKQKWPIGACLLDRTCGSMGETMIRGNVTVQCRGRRE